MTLPILAPTTILPLLEVFAITVGALIAAVFAMPSPEFRVMEPEAPVPVNVLFRFNPAPLVKERAFAEIFPVVVRAPAVDSWKLPVTLEAPRLRLLLRVLSMNAEPPVITVRALAAVFKTELPMIPLPLLRETLLP